MLPAVRNQSFTAVAVHEVVCGRVSVSSVALSNAASVLTLLAYPFAIEPLLTVSAQLQWWSTGYAVLVLLACLTALLDAATSSVAARPDVEASTARPLLWIALAACASTLWLSVASHLSQAVAPVPMLWVLPLSLYLLTFILCFDGRERYDPATFRGLLPVALIAASYRLSGRGPDLGIGWELVVFSFALFVCCMSCHGELARTKPEQSRGQTLFYLTIAFGRSARRGVHRRCRSFRL